MESLGGSRARRAFTLVELLVVIGIIAVLISVLLPVLASARRSAAAVKCASALRELGNAYQMYAMDNKQFYPPLRINGAGYTITFNSVPPINFTSASNQQLYWMYFLAKYVSKGKFAPYAGAKPEDLAYAMRSVLWGCPNFQPIFTTSTNTGIGGTAVVYTGYGYNGFPEYTPAYPKVNAAPPYNLLGDSLTTALDTKAVSSIAFVAPKTNASGWANYNFGHWYKQTDYTKPGERALLGDCRAYVLEAMSADSEATIAGQADLNSPGNVFWTANSGSTDPGQTSYDFYRHGKYPQHVTSNSFSPTGGKVGFNVLFADGHVSTLIQRQDGFKAARMRFPG